MGAQVCSRRKAIEFSSRLSPPATWIMANVNVAKGVVPIVGGLVGLWGASYIVPVMYHWDLIPMVGSPAYWERAGKIRYDHYSEGIVYSPYDTGNPISEIPAECVGKMYLRTKSGHWKLQSEMSEHE